MTCHILTPDLSQQFSDIRRVMLPTTAGTIAILPHHEPLLAALQAGEVRVSTAHGEEVFAISSGFAEVSGEDVSLLLQTAEPAADIDIMRAEQAKAETERLMKDAADDVHFGDAAALLERNIARLKVVERHRLRSTTKSRPPEIPPTSQ